MNILGLSYDYHDSAAVLVMDGKVVAAAQEERFSRKKNDPGFPEKAIRFCLDFAGISATSLDRVVYYENTLKKFDRIVWASKQQPDKGDAYLEETVDDWIVNGKFFVAEKICDHLGISHEKVSAIDHHLSHASSAFLCSAFDESTIITIDGVGESETATVSTVKNGCIKQEYSIYYPESFGLFYSAFTAYLGFEVNEGEYKVMGMAGYGEPVYAEEIRTMIQVTKDGRFKLDHRYFDFLCPEIVPYSSAMVELFGPAREPGSDLYFTESNPSDDASKSNRKYADIAASVQLVFEEALMKFVTLATEKTGIPNLCMAGGVALNSSANGKIKTFVEQAGGRLYIHPAAGDAGGALGSALYCHYQEDKNHKPQPLTHVYLGQSFTRHDCKEVLTQSYLTDYREFSDRELLVEFVAGKLVSGSVVGWFQGRSEWGPRALGNRSILANPMIDDMKKIVNEKIKFRETFRPFAPSVLVEHAQTFFEMDGVNPLGGTADFMLSIVKVREDKKHLIPAITHVDGTARVHLVRKEINPLYYSLIEAFGEKTGVPMVLNTSFNLKGKPIVNSPRDAIETFNWCDMDCLVLENFFLEK